MSELYSLIQAMNIGVTWKNIYNNSNFDGKDFRLDIQHTDQRLLTIPTPPLNSITWLKGLKVLILGNAWTEFPKIVTEIKSLEYIKFTLTKIEHIPRDIYKLSNLMYFETYMNYSLHYLPFEIVHCANLKSYTISRRARYGVSPHVYPKLEPLPLNLTQPPEPKKDFCSVCLKSCAVTYQLWTERIIGQYDKMPLLVHVCSNQCLSKIEQIDTSHLKQPY